MKRNTFFGLLAVALGGAVLSPAAWAGSRSSTPTTSTTVVNAGTGVGSTQTVSTQIRYSNSGTRSCSGRTSGTSSASASGTNSRYWGRGYNNNNNNGVTVIYPDNGYGYGNYNNANYLGYPPWYRLNYYTPWASDYENGTAGLNVPSSHANRGYGIPDAVGESMAYSPNNASAPRDAATVDYVVAVQRELRRRGFYQGTVNGLSDGPTRAAIRSYETSLGMPVTGVIGFPLLRTLGFF